MSGLNIPNIFIRKYINSALNVIIHLARLVDGSRKVTSLTEVVGMEGDTVVLQEIFSFEQTGVNPEGKVKGTFRANGIRPKFVDKFRALNISVPYDLFDSKETYKS